MPCMFKKVRSNSGQMSVEFAVVIPVLLMVLVVVVDAMTYISECARFDHAAPQAILSCGVTNGEEEFSQGALTSAVEATLAEQFDASSEKVHVSASESWGDTTYVCTLEMTPWPLADGGIRIFNMTVPTALKHTYKLAVDPYAPGALL